MGIPGGTGRFPANISTFGRYNQGRIDRLRASLTDSGKRVLDCIPVLLHENSPELPGGSTEPHAPCGIACFSYSPFLRDLLAHEFPSFSPPRKIKSKLEIQFIATIGSAGTMAFTSHSDLDVWIGLHRIAMGEERFEQLSEKLRSIELWAAETAGLEIHFFPVDLGDIRKDHYGGMNGESCGTALGKLLKDEFYRTAIFLCGKWPFFWVMPPGTSDADYAFHIARLTGDASFPSDSFIDLGNVHRLSLTEFYGAALWQMLKGTRFPFKSVLKMGLLDAYSSQGRQNMPLCARFKQEVLAGGGPEQSDPYLFMIESLRAYYTEISLVSLRELIEECFLVRGFMGICGSKQRRQSLAGSLWELGGKWGWNETHLRGLQDYFQWDSFKRDNFHKRILKFLLDSYKRIRQRSSNASVRISPQDMTVLGRKLASFLERKNGKIARDLSLLSAQTIAAIEFRQQGSGHLAGTWNILVKAAEGPEYQALSTAENPFVACAWCSRNGYYDGRQRLGIHGRTALIVKEADLLMRSLNSFFPLDEVDTLDVDSLLSQSRATHLYIVPNWHQPQWSHGLGSILVYVRTSIGELFYFVHQGSDCEGWLKNDLLLKRIGVHALSRLQWEVHLLRANVGSTRRTTDSLSRMIRECIVTEKYRHYKSAH